MKKDDISLNIIYNKNGDSFQKIMNDLFLNYLKNYIKDKYNSFKQ